MTYILELIVSIISSIGFALIFSIPKKTLIISGITGGFGWLIYRISLEMTGGVYMSTFVSSFAIAAISEVLAKFLKHPALVFIFPGIINLCPGVYIYRTMTYFISNQSEIAISSLYQAIAIAGSIAFGVLLASSFSTSLRSFRRRPANRTKY